MDDGRLARRRGEEEGDEGDEVVGERLSLDDCLSKEPRVHGKYRQRGSVAPTVAEGQSGDESARSTEATTTTTTASTSLGSPTSSHSTAPSLSMATGGAGAGAVERGEERGIETSGASLHGAHRPITTILSTKETTPSLIPHPPSIANDLHSSEARALSSSASSAITNIVPPQEASEIANREDLRREVGMGESLAPAPSSSAGKQQQHLGGEAHSQPLDRSASQASLGESIFERTVENLDHMTPHEAVDLVIPTALDHAVEALAESLPSLGADDSAAGAISSASKSNSASASAHPSAGLDMTTSSAPIEVVTASPLPGAKAAGVDVEVVAGLTSSPLLTLAESAPVGPGLVAALVPSHAGEEDGRQAAGGTFTPGRRKVSFVSYADLVVGEAQEREREHGGTGSGSGSAMGTGVGQPSSHPLPLSTLPLSGAGPLGTTATTAT